MQKTYVIATHHVRVVHERLVVGLRAGLVRDVRWDKIDYPDTDQWGSFKAQQKLHFKAFFHAVY